MAILPRLSMMLFAMLRKASAVDFVPLKTSKNIWLKLSVVMPIMSFRPASGSLVAANSISAIALSV